jgi:hypothetical protein
MPKANILTIRVPSDLKSRIARVAAEQGVSINQLAMYMFTKELGNIEAGQYMSNFLKGFSNQEILSDFDDIMSKVKNRTIPVWDKL